MWTLAPIFLKLLFKIIASLSVVSQESAKNLQRAFGAEGRIEDLKFQIRSLKYQLNNK